MMRSVLLRFDFGLGFFGSLPAPGTWGSIFGLALAWVLPFQAHVVLFILFSFIGLIACPAVVREFGEPDPQWFIWDEVCGMMLSVLWAPKTPVVYAAAFLLFRFLDARKPWPIWTFERHTGPKGILLDDLAAGALTAAALPWIIKALSYATTQAHVSLPAF